MAKLSSEKTFTVVHKILYTIHWKTFAVHQAVAIIYCTSQMILSKSLIYCMYVKASNLFKIHNLFKYLEGAYVDFLS